MPETLAQASLPHLLSLISYVPHPHWKCCSARVGLDRSRDTQFTCTAPTSVHLGDIFQKAKSYLKKKDDSAPNSRRLEQ